MADITVLSHATKQAAGAGGDQIVEFVRLRSKLFPFRKEDGKGEKKCRGVKKNTVKKIITFEQYRDCLFNNLTYHAKFNTLESMRLLPSALPRLHIQPRMIRSTLYQMTLNIERLLWDTTPSFNSQSCRLRIYSNFVIT